jgi:hypothetical protein
VITTQDEKVLGIFYLVGQEQTDCFERLLAPIHVVTQEEVVGLWGEATIFKQTKEVIVLAMDITTNLKPN